MIPAKMKAIVKTGRQPGAELREVDVPRIGPRDVLVKVKVASICGTDLHIYNWDEWAANRIKPPRIFGHELAGEVVAVGPEVKSVREGDYISAECHATCGTCYQCRTGKGHICQDYEILGVDFDGCFADYVRVPEPCVWKNDPDLPPEFASIQDPFGNAVLTVLSGEIVGKTVLVIGCGAIGLFAVGIARTSGAAYVIGMDINDYRLDLAKTMGARYLINPKKEDAVSRVREITGGAGVDVVLEMSGNAQAIHDGFHALKNGGRMSMLGIPAKPVAIDLAQEVVFKGITIHGITGRELFGTWYKTAAFLNGNLDVSPVITHRFPMEDFAKGFDVMNTGNCGKVVLYP